MKTKILSFLLTVVFAINNITFQGQECIKCDPNSNNIGDFATALGKSTTASGHYSFAGGENSVAGGKRSFAFGNSASATGINSFALGSSSTSSGNGSFALGIDANSLSTGTFAIGTRVKANYALSFAIGSGPTQDILENNQMESMIIGFNSNKPTLFISRSPNTGWPNDKTGRVAIGNMTDPQAKLHIYADDNEDATLLLEPSNWSGGKIAKLMLGTQDFWLETGNSIGMQFNSPDGFILQAGNTQTVFINQGQFEVQGTTTTQNFKLYDASNPPDDGYLLQSDANGNAAWVPPSTLPGSWQVNPGGNGIYYQGGNVGIGTVDTYGAMLAVKGKIMATEVEIKHEADWYDYVFEKNYKLRTLAELETFVNKNKHLPDVPSAEEVKEKGINLGEMNGVLLKKVEELTLYIIQQQKVIDELQQKVEKLTNEK